MTICFVFFYSATMKSNILMLNFLSFSIKSCHYLFSVGIQINAFIQCFVAVRRICSLYDLEVAVCENEGIEKFEELGLGPLVRHPLVLHYYSVKSDTLEVYKITSDEIISLLSKYMDTNKEIKVEDFLDFIVKKRSVASKEELGIRIQSMGYVTSFLFPHFNKHE